MTEAQRKKHKIYSLPANLYEAVMEMKKSQLVKETLGEHVFSKYIDAKLNEWEQYTTKVTAWELEEYLTKY